MGLRGPKPRPAEERLKKYIVIDSETGCHNWTGAKDKAGYGRIRVDGKWVRVHRLAYEQHMGQKIPEGMCVLHECDNPPCCNPEHLCIGTNQDNMNDKVRKGRQSRLKGEKNGRSELAYGQVIEIRDSSKTLKQLSEEYGVSFGQIGKIKRRERWSHI